MADSITKKTITLFFIFIFNLAFAFNTELDSLQRSYESAETDTLKARLLINIGGYYYRSNPDSALHYYNLAYQQCKNAKVKAPTINELKVNALRLQGVIHRIKGDFDEASIHLQKALDLAYRTNSKEELAFVYSSMGVLNRNIGNNKKALENYHKALEIYKEAGSESGISACYNNIGIIHDIEKNYTLALEYYKKAIAYFKKENNKLREGIATMNMGSVYMKLEDFEKALECYAISMELFSSINNIRGIGQVYNNKALVYAHKEELQKSLEYFNMSLKIHTDLGDLKGQASAYNNISDLYLKLGNYSKSANYAKKALELALSIESLRTEVTAYSNLRKANMKMNNYYQASSFADKYITRKDSLHSIEISKEIADLEARYQSEKRLLEIQNLKSENELKEAEIQSKNRMLTTITISFIVVVLLLFVIFYQYYAKKKANSLLLLKNADIENKNEEIRSQRDQIEYQYDEIKLQNNQLSEQKNLLEIFNNKLTDSIQYAKSIQTALLPDNKNFYSYFSDAFVFEQPSDIVGGDFYWMYPISENKIIIAVADCTGHGVPGAFMSVLGITLLNDIIIKNKEYKMDAVLNSLRSGFITALHQDSPGSMHKEGADISICLYDKSKRTIQFAGAKSQIWLLKDSPNKKDSENNKLSTTEIVSYKGDSFPIGYHKKAAQFSKQTISLDDSCKGLYMFTDGFRDQLKHDTQRRYTSKRFMEKVIEISDLPMNKQYSDLKSELEAWKGNNRQIDDIIIIGLKF